MGKCYIDGRTGRFKPLLAALLLTITAAVLLVALTGQAYAATPVRTVNTNTLANVSLAAATPTPTPTQAAIVRADPNLLKNVSLVKATPTPTAIPNMGIGRNMSLNQDLSGVAGSLITPGKTLAYATIYEQNKVIAIDTATNTIKATISVGNTPAGLAVSPDGARVFVANGNDGTVSVISTADNTVVKTISVGKGPVEVAFSPDGSHAYVANMGDNTTSDIDVATYSVVGTYPTGHKPFGIATNPVNGDVYVVNMDDKTMSVLRSGALVATVPVGKDPSSGIVVTPDGKHVYVANVNSNNLTVIDTATNTVSTSISTARSPYGLALSGDGKKLYVTGLADQKLQVIDTASNTIVSAMDLPYPAAIGLSADEKTLYVGNNTALHASINIVDVATNTVKGTVGSAAYYYDIAVVRPAPAAGAGAGSTVTPTPDASQGQDQQPAQTSGDSGSPPSYPQWTGGDQSQGATPTPDQPQVTDQPQQTSVETPTPAAGSETGNEGTPTPIVIKGGFAIPGFEGLLAVLGLIAAIGLLARRNW